MSEFFVTDKYDILRIMAPEECAIYRKKLCIVAVLVMDSHRKSEQVANLQYTYVHPFIIDFRTTLANNRLTSLVLHVELYVCLVIYYNTRLRLLIILSNNEIVLFLCFSYVR